MAQFWHMTETWDREDRDEALAAIRDSIAVQFNDFYGHDMDSLEMWTNFLTILRVPDIPDDVFECQEVSESSFRLIMSHHVSHVLIPPAR